MPEELYLNKLLSNNFFSQQNELRHEIDINFADEFICFIEYIHQNLLKKYKVEE